MKKIFTLLCCSCILFTAQARQHTIGDSLVRCTVIAELPALSGQLVNCWISGLINDSSFQIKADRYGKFNFTVQSQWLNGISLEIDSVTNCSFSVLHNDTIRLQQLNSIIRVLTNNSKRDTLIKTDNENASKWVVRRAMRLQSILNDTLLNIPEKVKQINDCYNEQVADLLASGPPPAVASEIITSNYYYYLDMLNLFSAIPRFSLYTVIPPGYGDSGDLQIPEPFNYGSFDLPLFYRCSEYRGFLLNYANIVWTQISSTRGPGDFPESEREREYFSIYYLVSNPVIRDWLLFKTLKNGLMYSNDMPPDTLFQHYYRHSGSRLTQRWLQQQYAVASRIARHKEAPDFTLPGMDGQPVSLSQFKGKPVFINFWGVGCGPCIRTIKEYYPAILEHYKDKEVVFLNICVDANEKTWKAKVAELRLGGINLLAEGWTRHPVCQRYNVHSVPRYFLIDKKGRIGPPLYPSHIYQILTKYPAANAFQNASSE